MEEIKSNTELDKYFDALKEENFNETFDSVESWLRREQFFSSGKIRKNKSAKVKYFLYANKAKLAYVVLIFFVTLIVANVKVTSKETVAGVISWTVNKNNKEAIEKIDKSEWLDKNQLFVDEQKGGDTNLIKYKFIIPDNAKLNLEQLKSKLDDIKDLQSVQVVPITEAVNVPLYAAALHSIFKSEIPTKFVNAEDIKRNVYEQLQIAGIDDNDCDVDYEPDAPNLKVLIRVPQDSLRHKIHDDIMKSINVEKILKNTEKMLENMKIQMNENLPKFKEEYGDYYKYDTDKLEKALKKVQIKLDSMKFNFNNQELEKSLENLHSLDTLDEYISRQVEKSLRENDRIMKKNEENMRRHEENMIQNEEKLKSLDTLNDYINYQVEINLQKNLQHLKILDSLGPIIEKQIKIVGHPNFDTAKFNKKMQKLKIKMDSLNLKFDGNKYDNEDEENMNDEKDDHDGIKQDMEKDHDIPAIIKN